MVWLCDESRLCVARLASESRRIAGGEGWTFLFLFGAMPKRKIKKKSNKKTSPKESGHQFTIKKRKAILRPSSAEKVLKAIDRTPKQYVIELIQPVINKFNIPNVNCCAYPWINYITL
jgi:hypothetical protein